MRYTQEDFERDVHILRSEMLDALIELQELDDDPEFPELFSTEEISDEPRTFMLFADGIVVDEEAGFTTNILDEPSEGWTMGEFWGEDLVPRSGLTFESRTKGRLNEYTGGDGWQPVRISDESWGHLEVGIEYKVKGMHGVQEFVGWVDPDTLEDTFSDDPTRVNLQFRDVADGDVWEAYDYEDTFAWGSGATPLVVKDSTIKRRSPAKRTSRY